MNYDCEALRKPKQDFAHVQCPCGEGEIAVYLRNLSIPRSDRYVAGCMECGTFGPPAGAQRSAMNAWRRLYDPERVAEGEKYRQLHGSRPISPSTSGFSKSVR